MLEIDLIESKLVADSIGRERIRTIRWRGTEMIRISLEILFQGSLRWLALWVDLQK